jgi:kumamolisin
MPQHELVPLPGSERTALHAGADTGPADMSERAELTLVLRRRAPAELGAAAGDVERVTSVLSGLGLNVTSVHPASRRVMVAGTIGELTEAFGTSVRMAQTGGVTHRYREGALYLPQSLGGIVEAVLGIDDRPQARPHFRPAAAAAAAAAAQPRSYSPAQVASIYQFPTGFDGTGQTVAVLEFGGGFATSDLSTYFGGLGIPVPSISAVSVDNAQNQPGSDPQGADVEVALDIDVIGAAAPGATQLVYFAPNSDRGFFDAVSDAAHATPAPIAISISWGQSEDQWTAQGRTALDNAIADACTLGITVTVAAGDNGSSDGAKDGSVHCDFPASSPHALACGGTRLEASGDAIASETVWNDGAGGGAGGGGVSDIYPVPAWQETAGVPPIASTAPAPVGGTAAAGGTPAEEEARRRRHPGSGSGGAGGTGTGPGSGGGSGPGGGRGVPDVAGNADPQTGYQLMSGGKAQVVGGTSAVAPLWAALIARLAQATGTRFGLIQPALYAGITPGSEVAGFNDIVTGSNGAYSAGPGWDACTGLGSPAGPALLTRLKG